jgi:Zn-dependent M16 (insulinase) family peptidase
VTHLTGQKAPDIFKALKAMCNYYLQHGFQVVFIKGDGAFKPLQAYMDTVYGAPQLNTTSANEHEPTAEQKIRHIMERTRAIIHSIPFNALPKMVLVNETT